MHKWCGGRKSEQIKMHNKGVGVAIPNKIKCIKRVWGSRIRTELNAQKGCGGRDSEQIKMHKIGVGVANPNKKNAQKGRGGRDFEQN